MDTNKCECAVSTHLRTKGVLTVLSEARRLQYYLLLGQRDRNDTVNDGTLPAIVCVAIQLDRDREGTRLTGLQDTEVPTAYRLLVDRNERVDLAHAGLPKTNSELVQRKGLDPGGVRQGCDPRTELSRRRHGPVVADGERVLDDLARREAIEAEVDRPTVVVVTDAQRERTGADVDVRRLLVEPGCSRRNVETDRNQRRDTDRADGATEDVTTGAGFRVVHFEPVSAAEAASGISENVRPGGLPRL